MLVPELLARLEHLDERVFCSPEHLLIWQAMRSLARDGLPADLRTVQARLEQQGRLDRAGGLAYLASLDLELPDLGRLDAYARVLLELEQRRRLASWAADLGHRVAETADPLPQLLSEADRTLAELRGGPGEAAPVTAAEAAEGFLEALEEGREPGLLTGVAAFDHRTLGLAPGWLVVVAGRPGHGKTAAVLTLAANATARGAAVGIVSLEMTAPELALRLLAMLSEVPIRRLRRGHLTVDQWARLQEATRELARRRLWIIDRPDSTPGEIRATARQARAAAGLDLLVVDYLQLLAEPGQVFASRNLEIAALTRGFKLVARELQVPVILCSQLSREPDRRADPRPTLADLRDSGAIEQDADLVVFVFRPELYDPGNPDLAGRAEWITAKFRGGAVGTDPVAFVAERTWFCDPEEVTP
jgi:replicative DNA helicase